MLEPGTTLGGVEIESVLRRDGEATVYRARDADSGERVAVELLAAPLPDWAEERLLGSAGDDPLDHPNLVTVRALRDTEGGLAVVSELVEGSTLSDWLIDHPEPPLPVALGLFRDLVLGMAFAHQRGLWHGNLDPNCVIVTDDGGAPTARITGFARPGGAPPSGPGRPAAAYAAPERIRQPEVVEPSADLFSLGCLLSRLVARRSPFEPRKGASVVLEPETRPQRRRTPKSVHPVLAELIGRLTRLDPTDRPSSCEWVLVRLADPTLPETSVTVPDPTKPAETEAEPTSVEPTSGEPYAEVVVAERAVDGDASAGRADEDADDVDTELDLPALSAAVLLAAPARDADVSPVPDADVPTVPDLEVVPGPDADVSPEPVADASPETVAEPVPTPLPATASGRWLWLLGVPLVAAVGFGLWVLSPGGGDEGERAPSLEEPAMVAPSVAPAPEPREVAEPVGEEEMSGSDLPPVAAPEAASEPSTPPQAQPAAAGQETEAPTTQAPARRATVRVEGDAVKIVLVRNGRTYPVPGELRPGSYTVRAWFDGPDPVEAGTVSVVASQDNVVTCKAFQMLCR